MFDDKAFDGIANRGEGTARRGFKSVVEQHLFEPAGPYDGEAGDRNGALRGRLRDFMPVFRAVRLSVQGRDCISDVAEIPNEFSIAIGQVPLELMDWIVDPRGQRLIGNPKHGGEHMI